MGLLNEINIITCISPFPPFHCLFIHLRHCILLCMSVPLGLSLIVHLSQTLPLTVCVCPRVGILLGGWSWSWSWPWRFLRTCGEGGFAVSLVRTVPEVLAADWAGLLSAELGLAGGTWALCEEEEVGAKMVGRQAGCKWPWNWNINTVINTIQSILFGQMVLHSVT